MKLHKIVELSSTTPHENAYTLKGIKGVKCGIGLRMNVTGLSAGFRTIGSATQTASEAALTCSLPADGATYIVWDTYGLDEVVALGIMDLRRLRQRQSGDDIPVVSRELLVRRAIEMVKRDTFDPQAAPAGPLEQLRYLVHFRKEYHHDLSWLRTKALYLFALGFVPGARLIDARLAGNSSAASTTPARPVQIARAGPTPATIARRFGQSA